jgi:tetrahydromethanopterin S-methyltransferase subunit B
MLALVALGYLVAFLFGIMLGEALLALIAFWCEHR